MAFEFKSGPFVVHAEELLSLEKALRAHFAGSSWGEVRRLISTRKVYLEGAVVTDGRQLLAPGTKLELRMSAPRKEPSTRDSPDGILYVDRQLVVVNKPAGLSSVDHEAESSSMQSEVRTSLSQTERRHVPPLFVVHRLDKVTSGVMLFARTKAAQTDLKAQFRAHTTGRFYTAVAHGVPVSGTLRFRLVKDRGDGYRGVTRDASKGYSSTTHVKVTQKLRRSSVIECRLETGRTHQIRIHLAEVGHPLVGDPLYLRDYRAEPIQWPRTLLHASYLDFVHPTQRKRLEYFQPLPDDFERYLKTEEG